MSNNFIKYTKNIFITLSSLVKGNENIIDDIKILVKHRYVVLFLISLFIVIAFSIFVVFNPFGLLRGIETIFNQEVILEKIWIFLMLIINIIIGIYFSVYTIYFTRKQIIKIFEI